MQKQPLDYIINGTGKDVVFLHGFLESPIIWEEMIKVADGNFRSINIHLPNHDSSNTSLYSKDLSHQTELLYHTLIEAKAQSPILIGHSLGGYLALAFINKYPEFTSGIALVNSTCLADTNEQKKRRTRAINLVEKHPSAFISMAVKNLFHKTHLEHHKIAINRLIDKAKTIPIPSIQASLAAMRDRTDTSESLRNFDKKKLFIYGKKDPLISLEASEKAINKSNCPSIALNAGHMSWLENKEKLQEVLLEFINKQ